MKKWLIILMGLTLFAAVATGAAFALTGNGYDDPEEVAGGLVDERDGELPPIRSDEDIDPNVCNPIHNIQVCTPEELEELGIEWYTSTVEAPLHGDPTYEQWLSEFGDGQVVYSIDDIINWIHNINACEGTEPGIVVDEDGTIEPDFGEDGPFLVPDRDAVCGPDQAVSITSDGQASCWDIGDASQTDDDQDMVSPLIIPEPESVQ